MGASRSESADGGEGWEVHGLLRGMELRRVWDYMQSMRLNATEDRRISLL